MTKHASGPFDVTSEPQPGNPAGGRMSMVKEFHGDLEATSRGQMLAISTGVKGSAGYVAMERVTGTLRGRTGTFALKRSGTITPGVRQFVMTVVPDSGTGELVGLSGLMTIDIVDGKPWYDFEYTLDSSY